MGAFAGGGGAKARGGRFRCRLRSVLCDAVLGGEIVRPGNGARRFDISRQGMDDGVSARRHAVAAAQSAEVERPVDIAAQVAARESDAVKPGDDLAVFIEGLVELVHLEPCMHGGDANPLAHAPIWRRVDGLMEACRWA